MDKYIIKDGYNGDMVYHGDDLAAAMDAFYEYDECCEGDWAPIFKGTSASELERRLW